MRASVENSVYCVFHTRRVDFDKVTRLSDYPGTPSRDKDLCTTMPEEILPPPERIAEACVGSESKEEEKSKWKIFTGSAIKKGVALSDWFAGYANAGSNREYYDLPRSWRGALLAFFWRFSSRD